jgi:hypothetical protein
MNLPVLSRRSAFCAFAATLAAPLLPAGASAQPTTRFRAIEVDVNNVRRSGDNVSADRIQRELPPLLQKSFAAHLAPGDRSAPVLRARVDLVTYGSNGSAQDPTNPFGAKDYIEGAGLVIGPGGRVIATYPLLAAVIARPDLTDITGQSGRSRTSNLAASFAQWLPGKMGV